MRLSKKYSQTWLVLLFLLTDLLLAQSQNLIEKLVTAIESNDTPAVTTLLMEQSQNTFPVLISYTGSGAATIHIELKESDRTPQIDICNLPCLKHFSDIKTNSRYNFKFLKNNELKLEYPFDLRDDCKLGYLTYFILDSYFKLEKKYIVMPQYSTRVDTIIRGGTITRVDTVTIVKEIKIPESSYFNYKVLSSGIISLGSFIWFLSERSMAIDDFDKYNNSKNMPDVMNYRISTEKHRVKRDIAGAISAATGIAFTYFLVKNLFFPPQEKIIKKEQLHSGRMERLQFGLIPDAFNNTLQFSMLVRF